MSEPLNFQSLMSKHGLLTSLSLSEPCRDFYGRPIDSFIKDVEVILTDYDDERTALAGRPGGDFDIEIARRTAIKAVQAAAKKKDLFWSEQKAELDKLTVPAKVFITSPDARTEIRAKEIRELLLLMEPAERAMIVLNAASLGEPGREILAAVFADPLGPARGIIGQTIVPAAVLDEANQTFWNAINLEVAIKRATYGEALGTFNGNVTKALGHLGDEGTGALLQTA